MTVSCLKQQMAAKTAPSTWTLQPNFSSPEVCQHDHHGLSSVAAALIQYKQDDTDYDYYGM